MCFSASASFGISAVLFVGGVFAVKKTRVLQQVPFSSIPLVFSFQQFTEGILWLSLTNPIYAGWQQASTYLFLIIAHVFWPLWVSISLLLLEKNLIRRKILLLSAVLGVVVSVFLAYSLFNYSVSSVESGHHISYSISFPHYIVGSFGVFYFISTVIPFFISTVKKMNLLGCVLLISFIITKLFFEEYLPSVWCFFAAPSSIIVLIIMAGFQTSYEKLNKIAINNNTFIA